MTYYVDPNTQQMYYQAPAQDQQAATAPAAAAVSQNAAVPPDSSTFLGLNASSSTFWTGAILGAGVALLVTNETVQKAVVKTFSKGMAAASAGVEEFKEKFEDAKAEVEAEAAGRK